MLINEIQQKESHKEELVRERDEQIAETMLSASESRALVMKQPGLPN